MDLPYRKNVAAFVINEERKILTCKRADKFQDWQLPQGGIDLGEAAQVALTRELKEEINLDSFETLLSLPQTISYDWPRDLWERGYKGQEQQFFVVKPTAKNWNPDLNGHHHIEFKEFSWQLKVDFIKLVEKSFRAPAYLLALEEIQKLKPDLL